MAGKGEISAFPEIIFWDILCGMREFHSVRERSQISDCVTFFTSNKVKEQRTLFNCQLTPLCAYLVTTDVPVYG